MDNPTANKSHLPCPSWMTQNGWSAASSQGPLINALSTSFDHLQAPNQSCTTNLSSLSSRNNPHTAMYKGSPVGGMPSSSSLFATDIPNLSQAISFGQQSHHPSSIMVTANQGKNVTSSSLRQSNQGLQPCRPQHLSVLSPHDPFKAFQNPISSQGLSGIQDLRPSLPSCRQHQAAFEGENMESAHVGGNTQSYVSSASQEQPQWVPPSQCRAGAVNDSVHANKDANKSTLASHEKRRSDVLQQRAQLLKQLAEMDKLLEALPPDNSSDGQPSADDPAHCDQTAERSKSHRSADCSSPSCDDEQNDACDTPEDPASPAESAKKDTASDTSGEDDDRDYLPGSDAESKEASSEECSDSNPASPASEEPASEEQKSGSSSAKSVTPANKTPMISQAAASQTPVLPATRRTNSKHRVYDKRNYCLFCSKCVLKLSRHLELLHSDRPEVAAAFQYPKHSKERQNIWKKLTNQGNFEHNKKVLKTGEGALVVRQRPKVVGRAKDFLPCLHCHGLFVKRNLFKHMRSCPENRENEKESEYGRKRIASKCVLASVDCESRGISDVSRSILSDMIYDDVTRAVMDDRIVLQFGEYMHNYYGRDANKQGYIRQNLRLIARLVLEAQKTTPMQKLEDFFHPSNFRHVLAAVNVLAGYDSETKRYASPSVAIKLGHSLQKTCSIVENNAVKSGDTKQAESARKFLSVYQKKWTKLVSSAALRSLRESKSNKAKQVPVAQDVKRLYFHLEKVHLTAEKNLRDGVSTGNYVALARVMLARTILFNRRKPREVSAIQLTDFTSRIRSDAPDDLDPSVTELEKVMCRFFTRVDVRGDGGRKVPVFLKPSFVSALELLAESREACGVPGKNPFLFGRPNTLSTYRGSECIQGFIKDCGAQISEVLTSKNIRKHFGKMLQLMNLDENEAAQIFGPNNKIQILRQCNDSTLDDIEMESEAETLDHGEDGPAAFYLQAPGGRSKKSVRDSQQKAKHTWGEAEVRAVERHLMRFIQEHKVPQKDDCIKCLEAESKALRSRSWKGVKDYVRNRITTLKRQSDCSQDAPSSSKRPRKADPQQERQAGSRDHDKASNAGGAAASSFQPAHGAATSSSKTKRPKSAKSSGRVKLHMNPDTYGRRSCLLTRGSISSSAPRAQLLQTSLVGDSHLKTKHTWGEAEVRAVERHMMSLIREHKVPQKDDCIRCLEAEPEALRNRSWKGVKDYVRNRITTLQRQSGFSRDSSKSRKRPRKADPQQMRQSASRQHAGSWESSDSSSAGDGAAPPYHQQGRGGTTSSSKSARPKSVKSGGRESHLKTKHTWGEAEVRAVERHMMSLIREHKVPQKDDCIRCLEAEPEALRNRSWKGVKDFVRNRITTLQRESGCFQDSPKSRKRPRRAEESSARYQQL